MIDPKIREQAHTYLHAHKAEILSDLETLVRVPSVRGEALPEMPYGKACADALSAFAKLCGRENIPVSIAETKDYLTADYGQGETTLGLFSHLDVVGVGEDWDVTAPFAPREKDGFLFGRGVSDDKSGAVISLYILKMLKELSVPMQSAVRVVCGVNEESGMADMDSYVSREPIPDFSLVIDTAFPLYHGNKSNVTFTAVQNEPFEEILNFRGGTAESGTVLGEAEAVLPYSDAMREELLAKKNERISVETDENGGSRVLVLRARGIPTHGALPEGSLNAGYLLCDLLSRCETLCGGDRRKTAVLAEMLGRYYGEWFGIAHTDVFGKTTCINRQIAFSDGKPTLYFNIRHGSTQTAEEIKAGVSAALSANGFSLLQTAEKPGYYIPADDSFVKGLLSVYAEFTGNANVRGVLNAGGTYARKLGGKAVETGTWMWKRPAPVLPQGHGNVHQPDEFIDTEGFLDALELNLYMLLEADRLVYGNAEPDNSGYLR